MSADGDGAMLTVEQLEALADGSVAATANPGREATAWTKHGGFWDKERSTPHAAEARTNHGLRDVATLVSTPTLEGAPPGRYRDKQEDDGSHTDMQLSYWEDSWDYGPFAYLGPLEDEQKPDEDTVRCGACGRERPARPFGSRCPGCDSVVICDNLEDPTRHVVVVDDRHVVVDEVQTITADDMRHLAERGRARVEDVLVTLPSRPTPEPTRPEVWFVNEPAAERRTWRRGIGDDVFGEDEGW